MSLRKRIFCLLCLVFFLVSPGLARPKQDGQYIHREMKAGHGLSLKLYGGASEIAGGDLNKGLEGLIDDSPPPAWRYGSIRKGEVDLSGVSVRVGVKIKLGR